MIIPIIPIHRTSAERTRVIEAAERIKADLAAAGIEAEIDDRDMRPGAKFYEWDERGADLRVEIGPKDIEKGRVFVRFLDGDGARVGDRVRTDDLVEHIRQSLAD